MRAILLALVLCAMQDPADKVRALIEKLGSEEIAQRESASADLIKLGPSILPALVEHLPKLDGEPKTRLYAVIRKIERDHKVAERVLRTPRVSIRTQGQSMGEIVAEIKKQTGVGIETSGISEEVKVKVDLEKVPFWKAIDEICKAHGGMMYTLASKRVIVEAVPYRDLPRIHHAGLFLFLDHFLVDQYSPKEGARITLKPVLGWSPGSSPLSYRLETEKMEDDVGTDLTGANRDSSWIFIGPQERDSIGGALYYHMFSGLVPDEARLIRVWKGKLHLRFALDLRKAASIADPMTAKSGSGSSDDGRVNLMTLQSDGRTVWLQAVVSTPLEKDADAAYHNLGLANLLVLTDSKGQMIRGRGEGRPMTGGVAKERGWATRTLGFTYTIPDGAEIVSLDLMTPGDTQDVEIPFEFRDLRFRGGAK